MSLGGAIPAHPLHTRLLHTKNKVCARADMLPLAGASGDSRIVHVLETVPARENVPAPASALIVEPLQRLAQSMASALSSAGFHVVTSDNYEDAKSLLAAWTPSVVLAEIRLGEHNGLQLVLRGKAAKASLAAIVMSTFDDPVIRNDAEKLGATFMLKPHGERELMAAVFRTMAQDPEQPAPVRPPFERRIRERRTAAAMDHNPERRRTDRRINRIAGLQRHAIE